LGGVAFGAGKVTVDQREGELPLPACELEPVRLELVAARVALVQRLSLDDVRTASCMHSTLAIDDRCLGGALSAIGLDRHARR